MGDKQPTRSPKSVRFADDAPSSSSASLSASRHVSENQALFSIDNDDVEGAADAELYGLPWEDERHSSATNSIPARSMYGLKSTIPSREAEYDAASDTLSDTDDTEQHDPSRTIFSPSSASSSRRDHRTTMPSLPFPTGLRQSVDVFGSNISDLRRTVLEGVEEVGRSTGLTENGELPDWLKRGAGVFDATTNMANSILGAGIVGLPYSMRQSGFVAGVVLLVGLAMLTDWTIRLIILNSKLSGRQTYIEIMDHCFGRKGKAAVSLFQFAFAFGGMCAFCVVIGDTIPHVLSAIIPSLAPGASWLSFLASRAFVITFCTLFISFPLSLYRDIENLSKASAVALVSMGLIVLTVVIRGPAMPAELKGDSSLRFTVVNPSHLVSSISVISFAFVCHHNSLLIYASLKEPSMDKFGKVTHYSTGIACACLTAMSIAGYWTFEEKTLGNVLNNFPEDDTFVNLARFAFGVNMFTTFPLEAFVCREVLETYFFPDTETSTAGHRETSSLPSYNVRRHIIITTSLVVTSLIVSLLTCDLGIVLELTGGLSATALAFIFPAVCFLKLAKEGEGKRIGVSSHRPSSTRASQYQPLPAATDGDESLDTLEASQGIGSEPDGPDHSHQARADIDIDEVQLPLRPGAAIRALKPGETDDWWGWWMSTKPLAIACAVFGTIVLLISLFQALQEVFSGKTRGAVHQC